MVRGLVALSSWLRPSGVPAAPGGLHLSPRLAGPLAAHPARVCGVIVALGVVAIALLPGLRFDSNVVHLRDPETESVRAWQDLLARPGIDSPWGRWLITHLRYPYAPTGMTMSKHPPTG